MTQQYFHHKHIPDWLMDSLIDIKVAIDMEDLSPQALHEHKEAFNKLAELTPIPLYKF